MPSYAPSHAHPVTHTRTRWRDGFDDCFGALVVRACVWVWVYVMGHTRSMCRTNGGHNRVLFLLTARRGTGCRVQHPVFGDQRKEQHQRGAGIHTNGYVALVLSATVKRPRVQRCPTFCACALLICRHRCCLSGIGFKLIFIGIQAIIWTSMLTRLFVPPHQDNGPLRFTIK